jgi:hypothetical protein
MKTQLSIKFLLAKIEEKGAEERKVVGGTYKAIFHFRGISDYFLIYGKGLFQSVGKDENRTYYKPWENSAFSSSTPEKILEQLGFQINKIEILGCGNDYKKTFDSFKSFLSWIGVSPLDLGINLPSSEHISANKETESKDQKSEEEKNNNSTEEKKIEDKT